MGASSAPRAFAAQTREPGCRDEGWPSQPLHPRWGNCAGTGPPAGRKPVLLGGGGELKTWAKANGHRWGPIEATFSSPGARPGAKPRGGTRPSLSPWTFPTGLASQRPAPSARAASGTSLGARSATLSPRGTGPQVPSLLLLGKLGPHAFVRVRRSQAHPFGGSRPAPTEVPLLLSRRSPFLVIFFSGTQKDCGAGQPPSPRYGEPQLAIPAAGSSFLGP